MNKGYTIYTQETPAGEQFRVQISDAFDASGRRKRTTKLLPVGTTKTDAHKEARILVKQKEEGTMAVANAKGTVAEYLHEWLKTRYDLAPHTLKSYHGKIEKRIIPHIGNRHLSALRVNDVEAMETDLQKELSGTTLLQIHHILRKALQDAFMDGRVLNNVADLVKNKPKSDTMEVRTFTVDQLNEFLDATSGTEYGEMYLLDSETGLRRSELVGLKWSDIDLDTGTLAVKRTVQRVTGQGFVVLPPKTKKSRRVVKLGADVTAQLRHHRAEQAARRLLMGSAWHGKDWVFTTRSGRNLDPDVVSRHFTKVAVSLGLVGIHLHSARHTHATMLHNAGVSARIIQDRLGHSNIQTTIDLYTHTEVGQQAAAAEVIGAQRRMAAQS